MAAAPRVRVCAGRPVPAGPRRHPTRDRRPPPAGCYSAAGRGSTERQPPALVGFGRGLTASQAPTSARARAPQRSQVSRHPLGCRQLGQNRWRVVSGGEKLLCHLLPSALKALEPPFVLERSADAGSGSLGLLTGRRLSVALRQGRSRGFGCGAPVAGPGLDGSTPPHSPIGHRISAPA